MREESVNFDRAAGYYDATRGFPSEQTSAIGEFIGIAGKLSEYDRVLEVGIGTGRIASIAAPYTNQYFGIDISSQMMARITENATSDNIYPTLADAHALPFPSNQFGASVVTHVFHLVKDPVQVLKEITRVLKPQGTLLHISNGGETVGMEAVFEAWHSVLPVQPNRYRMDMDSALSKLGWKSLGDKQVYTYTRETTPRQVVDLMERRVWSSTWHIDDEIYARAINAAKQALNDSFPDPDSPVESTLDVTLRQYISPDK